MHFHLSLVWPVSSKCGLEEDNTELLARTVFRYAHLVMVQVKHTFL